MNSVVRWMGQRFPVRTAVIAALGGSLGACGAMMNMMPDTSGFRLPDRSTFLPTRSSVNYSISPSKPVASADLVDAQGGCAASAAQPDASSHGVALDMTECQVVRTLGQPQAIDIPSPGGSGGDDRRVVLTYKTGDRPGIYVFNRGRLTDVQRGDDAPPAVAKKPPAKRAKPQPPA